MRLAAIGFVAYELLLLLIGLFWYLLIKLRLEKVGLGNVLYLLPIKSEGLQVLHCCSCDLTTCIEIALELDWCLSLVQNLKSRDLILNIAQFNIFGFLVLWLALDVLESCRVASNISDTNVKKCIILKIHTLFLNISRILLRLRIGLIFAKIVSIVITVLEVFEFRILIQHLIVRIMVNLVLELHGYILLRQSINDLGGELLFRPKFYQFLLLTVKDHHEYILAAQDGQFNGFLYDTALPLAICDIPLVLVTYVLNVIALFLHFVVLMKIKL